MKIRVMAIESDLERQLGELIQDEGLVEARLGGRRDTIGSVLNYDSMRTLQEIKNLAMSLGDDKYAVALQNALGLTWPSNSEGPADNLTDRRKALLESGEFPQVSEATLRRWEKRAISLLIDRILAVGSSRISDVKGEEGTEDLLQLIGQLHDAHEEVIDKAHLLMTASDNLGFSFGRRLFPMSDQEKGKALDVLTTLHLDQARLNSKLAKTISNIRHY